MVQERSIDAIRVYRWKAIVLSSGEFEDEVRYISTRKDQSEWCDFTRDRTHRGGNLQYASYGMFSMNNYKCQRQCNCSTKPTVHVNKLTPWNDSYDLVWSDIIWFIGVAVYDLAEKIAYLIEWSTSFWLGFELTSPVWNQPVNCNHHPTSPLLTTFTHVGKARR